MPMDYFRVEKTYAWTRHHAWSWKQLCIQRTHRIVVNLNDFATKLIVASRSQRNPSITNNHLLNTKMTLDELTSRNNSILKSQPGFLSFHSTVTALLGATDISQPTFEIVLVQSFSQAENSLSFLMDSVSYDGNWCKNDLEQIKHHASLNFYWTPLKKYWTRTEWTCWLF